MTELTLDKSERGETTIKYRYQNTNIYIEIRYDISNILKTKINTNEIIDSQPIQIKVVICTTKNEMEPSNIFIGGNLF